jgi:signal peptidase I
MDGVDRKRPVMAMVAAVFLPAGGHFVLGLWRRALAWLFIEGLVVYAGSWISLWWSTVLLWSIPLILLLRVVEIIDVRRHWPEVVPHGGRVALLLLGLITLVTLEGSTIRHTLVEMFKIPSGAMTPTLQVGDHVLVDRRAHTVERGDVVVFKYPREPEKDFVKRVMGVGGDLIELREGLLHINGKQVERAALGGDCHYDDYEELSGRWERRACTAIRETLDGRSWTIYEEHVGIGPAGPWTVPAGHYFVMGDNRSNSHDSRHWGYLPADHLKGRVVRVVWSLGQSGYRGERTNLPVR